MAHGRGVAPGRSQRRRPDALPVAVPDDADGQRACPCTLAWGASSTVDCPPPNVFRRAVTGLGPAGVTDGDAAMDSEPCLASGVRQPLGFPPDGAGGYARRDTSYGGSRRSGRGWGGSRRPGPRPGRHTRTAAIRCEATTRHPSTHLRRHAVLDGLSRSAATSGVRWSRPSQQQASPTPTNVCQVRMGASLKHGPGVLSLSTRRRRHGASDGECRARIRSEDALNDRGRRTAASCVQRVCDSTTTATLVWRE